jgi:hypothetical protein
MSLRMFSPVFDPDEKCFPTSGTSRQMALPDKKHFPTRNTSRVERRPIDITRTAGSKTLRVGKAFVKDVKCLIPLDLCDSLPC